MANKTKDKRLDEILEKLIAQAKEGSCKTCQFCISSPIQIEDKKFSHYCLLQGNVNSIFFTQESLVQEAYPGKCEEGSWYEGDKAINGCLCFKPRIETNPETATLMASIYRKYMQSLIEQWREEG